MKSFAINLTVVVQRNSLFQVLLGCPSNCCGAVNLEWLFFTKKKRSCGGRGQESSAA